MASLVASKLLPSMLISDLAPGERNSLKNKNRLKFISFHKKRTLLSAKICIELGLLAAYSIMYQLREYIFAKDEKDFGVVAFFFVNNETKKKDHSSGRFLVFHTTVEYLNKSNLERG